jgi:adenine-specific DNA methylase
MVALLGETGELVGDIRPIQHAVKFFEKGDKPLEIVTSRQWYIRNGGRSDELKAEIENVAQKTSFNGIKLLDGSAKDLVMQTGANEGDHSPVAPVDLSQAIIGPGMAIFSRYDAVLEADGTPMTVKTALQLINRFLAEDDFDGDTQFCLHWFSSTDGTPASSVRPTRSPAQRERAWTA